MSAAVALRHIDLLAETNVLANVVQRSSQLKRLLDEKIAPRDDVADVRLCGLMGGVEIEPGPPGHRRGRKVCAAATRRGVLLRPLGDVVVLMPPLSITADEIETIVAVLVESLDEVPP